MIVSAYVANNMACFLKSFLSLYFILTFAGCKRDLSSAELISKFTLNKIYLDSLVLYLNKDKKLDSFFHNRLDSGLPDIKISYPVQFNLIEKTGITEISSCPVCPRCPRWYYIKTNWPGVHPIYLIYGFRDSIENEKGFYNKDEYQNETWGMGDNWKIFRFVDTIRNIKQ